MLKADSGLTEIRAVVVARETTGSQLFNVNLFEFRSDPFFASFYFFFQAIFHCYPSLNSTISRLEHL